MEQSDTEKSPGPAETGRKGLVPDTMTLPLSLDAPRSSLAASSSSASGSQQSLSSTTSSTMTCSLQEHEPLSHLIAALPAKAQKGLFSMEIDYTCIDASQEYIALGTNTGIVFLYDRLGLSLQRLNCQIKTEVITCIKMQQSVDYVVAVGTATGLVFIFQLPSYLPGRNKQLQMFTAQGLHCRKITCVEWSQNTLKLFSGDQEGNVVCTEMDYEKNKSWSYLVCQEPHEIVQLSYYHCCLIISTKFRSVMVFTDESNRKQRIGTKDRKILGDFGACFQSTLYRLKDAVIYATRPGLRIWKANTQGVVLTTYMFKSLLNGNTPVIPLLPDTVSQQASTKIEEKNFGHLVIFDDDKLVTWHEGALFVLDPSEAGSYVGWQNNLGEIQGVAVTRDEIFVLRRGYSRRMVRISARRDLLNEPVTPSVMLKPSEPPPRLPVPPGGESQNSPVHKLHLSASKMSHNLVGAIKEKIQLVQEGQKPSTLPPWGLAPAARKEASIEEDLDSCKEANSQSSMSNEDMTPSPVHSSVPGYLEGQLTAMIPKTDSLVQSQISTQSSRTSSTACEEDSLRTSQSLSTSGGTLMGSSIETAFGSGPFSAIEPVPTLKTGKREEASDIIFSRKPKKHKKKKHKQISVTDAETESIASGDLEFDQNPVPTTEAIGAVENSHVSTNQDCYQDNKEILLKDDVFQSGAIEETSKLASPDDISDFVTSIIQSHRASQSDVIDKQKDDENVQQEELQADSSSDSKTLSDDRSSSLETSGQTSTPSGSQVSGSREESLEILRVSGSREESLEIPRVSGSREESLEIPIKSDKMEELQENDQNPYVKNVVEPENSEVLPMEMAMSRSQTDNTLHHIQSTPSAPGIRPSFSLDSSITELKLKDKKPNREDDFETLSKQLEEDDNSECDSPSHEQKELEGSKSFYQTSDSSTDDFYSRYRSDSMYSLQQIEQSGETVSIEEAIDYQSVTTTPPTSLPKKGKVQEEKVPTKEDLTQKYADTWTEFLCPGNLQSMCISQNHVWCVDKSERLHYSSLSGTGLKWRKVEEPARHIAVSPSGAIVWRIHRGSAYAGTKITPRAPAGMKWVEAARDVSYIAVDDSSAWYIKTKGDVMMQKGLNRERPCYRSTKVLSKHKYKLAQVACRDGVVWGLSESRRILVRLGIQKGREEGFDWKPISGEGSELLVFHFSLGDMGTSWVVDAVGRVWFTTGVTSDNPMGSGKWWQVSMSEYLMSDSTALDMLKSLTPQNLTKLLTTAERGGLITVNENGVWVCPGCKHVLHVCRGSLLGHRWEVATPGGMAPSTMWRHISVSAIEGRDGLIWAQQSNNAVFCFPPDGCKMIEIPSSDVQASLVSLCATREAVWGLLDDGRVMIRGSMGAHCPQGLRWLGLDLTQLGGSKLVFLSIGMQNVWGVDNNGMVYLRIGIKAPSKNYLNPAWVPVDGTTHSPAAKFVKVISGPSDWMVWAVDNKKCVYARRGITDSMPIGTHWVYVSGTPAVDMCISENFVYALNGNGEILVRFGITPDNITGDYWKTIPGAFRFLSVTQDDDLWGINDEDQLRHRVTTFLQRQRVLPDLTSPSTRSANISDEWVLI